jgi:hypothetical protein
MAITEKDVAAQAKDVARRIGDVEQSRPAGLAIAAWLNDARLDALRTEHIRLAHKYGAEHARVAQHDQEPAAGAGRCGHSRPRC